MIFWKRSVPVIAKSPTINHRVTNIYGRQTIPLAMAEATNFAGYSLRGGWDEEVGAPSGYVLHGIVRHSSVTNYRILCDIEFVNRPRNSETLGKCFLEYWDKPQPDGGGTLRLEVQIIDHGQRIAADAFAAVRDAAISRVPFVHMQIITDKLDPDVAQSQLKEKGYGPSKTIVAFKMWPRVLSPSAPDWAWNRE